MQVTQDVKARVVAKLQEGIAIANKRYNLALQMPHIDYKLTGATAGKAYLRKWSVSFNAILLMENIDAFIARTVPHELAHLITDMVYPHVHTRSFGTKSQPHGSHWQSVMRVLGVSDITRCHSYDVSNSKRQVSRTSYVYACVGCNYKYTMGAKRHQRMQRDPNAYWCRCRSAKGTKLVYMHANNPVKTVSPTITVSTPKQTSGNGSKLDSCRAIYAANTGLTRQQMIQLFVAKAGCTPAGASTYYNTCRKI